MTKQRPSGHHDRLLDITLAIMNESITSSYRAIILGDSSRSLMLSRHSGRFPAPKINGPSGISSRSFVAKAIVSGKPLLSSSAGDFRKLCSSLARDPRGRDAARFMLIPMVTGDRHIGAMLYVRNASQPRFDQTEMQLAMVLAEQAALSLACIDERNDLDTKAAYLLEKNRDSKSKLREARKWGELHNNLMVMSGNVLAYIELDLVLKAASSNIIEFSDADQCFVAVFGPGKSSVPRWGNSTRQGISTKPRYSTKELLDAIRPGRRRSRTIVTYSRSRDRASSRTRSFMKKSGIRTLVCVPFNCGNGLCGIMCLVYFDTYKRLSQVETGFVEGAVAQISIAVSFARLYGSMKMHTNQLEERSDDLSVLFEVGRKFSSTFELEKTLRFAVSTFVNRLDYDRAAVFVVDPEGEKTFRMENAAKPGTGKASFDVKWLMDDPSDVVGFLGQNSPAVITDATTFAFSNKALTEYFQKTGYKAFAAIPLISRQQRVGILALGYVTDGKSFTARKLNMLETFGSLIASAIENCRLMDIISGKYRRAGWLSDRIVKAQEEERRRVARNLHDEIGAGLTMLKINLQIARKKPKSNDIALRKAAEELDHGLGEMIAKVRDLTADLRPPILDDLGLAPALKSFIQQFTKRSGLEIGFEDNLSELERYPDTDIVVYRIVQEALTNVAKHADATKVRVTISEHAGECVLCIGDNGSGFDPNILNDKDLRGAGFGLQNMRQQVDIRGGKFEIESAPNRGTRLKVRIPWTK